MTDEDFLRLHTSGSTLDTCQKGNFGALTVWHNPKSLANVLFLALVTDKHRMTMDTYVTNSLNVHISTDHVLQFSLIDKGLCSLDTTNIEIHELRHDFSFLNTVDYNKSCFSSRDVRKAENAFILNQKLNFPPLKSLLELSKTTH